MKEIQLTQGKVALIDDADFERVSQFKWFAYHDKWNWYAARAVGRNKQISLHKFLLPNHKRIDHKNGNGLDDQRHNLRPVSPGQNTSNSRKCWGCTSRFKGVSWNKRKNKWSAQITNNKKQQFLGCYKDEVDAALAYDVAARKCFGEFSKINFSESNSAIREIEILWVNRPQT